MPRPIWFEIPADDVSRALKFYENVFGWKANKLEGMDYWIINLPRAPQSVMGGAIMPRSMGKCTRNTIYAEPLDEYIAKVEKAGGKLTSPKMPIPGGMWAACTDPDGVEFGLMEPTAMEEAPPPLDPKAVPMLTIVHFEIPVDDVQRAIKFYETVFDWKVTKFEGPWEYWMVETGPADEDGFNGAIHPRHEHSCTSNTVAVPDIDEYLRKVNGAGGKITMEKQYYEKVGHVAVCEDTEGNAFGLHHSE
jgi:predicted enzyme related to lactoylglutathione lyase